MGVDQGSGVWMLEDPLTNKGTAFSEEERSEQGLRGLLPAVVETLEQQVRRRYQAYQEQPADVPGTLTCTRCRTPPLHPDGRTGLPALLDHADQLFDAARGHRLHQLSGLGLEHHPPAELRRGPGCLLFAPGAQRDDQRDLVAREQLSCHGGGQPSTGRAACQEPGEQLARVGGAQPAQLRDAALCRSRQAR
jgi:hypothetical protein